MPIGGSIAAIGSLGAAAIGSNAARGAANKQEDAARNALAFQQMVYGQNQANFKPYLDTGKGATYSLASLYGLPGEDGKVQPADYSGFTKSPDYNFALEQGKNATTNLLSAQGNLLSGSGLTALTNFGQGLASQQYGNYFSRLMQLSNLGQTAASNLATSSTNAAAGIGNTMQGIGQAQASGIVGSGNAWSGGLNNAAQSLALSSYLGAKNPSGYNPAAAAANPGAPTGGYYGAGGGLVPGPGYYGKP